VEPPLRLRGARRSLRVLYRSRALDGSPIAVSGMVWLPRGRAPRGGWPVLSWAHGTTGVADACAISKPSGLGFFSYAFPQLEAWLARGYAVVATDYEGLGTAGPHPYLIGRSEGRGVLDIARAAQALDRRVGRRLAIAGHSQGGQAALFAASLAPRWTPDLRLSSTVAFAPPSQLSVLIGGLRLLTAPSPFASALYGMILANAARAVGADPAQVLSDETVAALPALERGCLADLARPEAFGPISPSELLRPGADTSALSRGLEGMNPAVRIRVPVLIVQGSADAIVPPALTDALAGQLERLGVRLRYRRLASVDHVGVVAAGHRLARRFIAKRLR
jgi:pimeloyl-ACP methyl ester carboxylesterase